MSDLKSMSLTMLAEHYSAARDSSSAYAGQRDWKNSTRCLGKSIEIWKELERRQAEAQAREQQVNALRNALDELQAKALELLGRESKVYLELLGRESKGYKANFLWPCGEDSVEQAGYEFANADTEDYRRDCWLVLKNRIAVESTSQTRKEIERLKNQIEELRGLVVLVSGDGYIPVKPGDTLQPYDEMLNIHGKWIHTFTPGERAQSGFVYRRKIGAGWMRSKPLVVGRVPLAPMEELDEARATIGHLSDLVVFSAGPGWVPVKMGDKILAGDEYIDPAQHTWSKSPLVGMTYAKGMAIHRRRVAQDKPRAEQKQAKHDSYTLFRCEHCGFTVAAKNHPVGLGYRCGDCDESMACLQSFTKSELLVHLDSVTAPLLNRIEVLMGALKPFAADWENYKGCNHRDNYLIGSVRVGWLRAAAIAYGTTTQPPPHRGPICMGPVSACDYIDAMQHPVETDASLRAHIQREFNWVKHIAGMGDYTLSGPEEMVSLMRVTMLATERAFVNMAQERAQEAQAILAAWKAIADYNKAFFSMDVGSGKPEKPHLSLFEMEGKKP